MDDDDEPTLPLMPMLPGSNGTITGRKRPFHLNPTFTEPVYSSELGVFSSDDDPGLDNYSQGRNKRRYKGAWYDHSQESATQEEDEDFSTPRKPVFSIDDHGSVPPSSGSTLTTWAHTSPPSSQKTSLPSWTQMSPSSAQKPSLPVSTALIKQSALVLEVTQQIDYCIDHGKEIIDFSDQNLDDDYVVPDTFERLCKLKLVPHLDLQVDHPDEGKYLHRESNIKLLMANNLLTRLPGTIFAIENLTILSLRGNSLTELPPAIGQCRNLLQLNVAYNKLSHLPFEVIEMIPKTDVIHYGNNFYELDARCIEDLAETTPEPAPDPDNIGHSRFDPRNRHMRAWYTGRGDVQFTDTTGRVYSSFTVPATGGSEDRIRLATEHTPPSTSYQGQSKRGTGRNVDWTTRVPSLAELCARSLVRAGQSDSYADMAGEADLVSKCYAAAGETMFQGGQWCAVCKKPFVIPRTQWIEFYFSHYPAETGSEIVPIKNLNGGRIRGNRESFVGQFTCPSLRRGCSWKCVPYGREPERWSCVPLKP